MGLRPRTRRHTADAASPSFPAAPCAPPGSGDLGLGELGLSENLLVTARNPSYAELYTHEVDNAEGKTTSTGAFAIDTGKFTGRSPKDKWIVKQGASAEEMWWGDVNRPITPEVFEELYAKVVRHYNDDAERLYVFDGYCGANPSTRRNVRFITEKAWQNHFVRNMFLRPESEAELDAFEPDFTIINACEVSNEDWERHGLNSEVFVAFNVEKKVAIIGGTHYGGEMKKGIFSMMNLWLPLEGIMSMHCSANVGKEGDTALFFGLSGTGKTTLSADPKRLLIGDDEHGWDDDGVFNFEGGCYAKTINLSAANEPEIHAAIRRDALLENVHLEGPTNAPDYFNASKTQNGRVSYPIYHIPNHEPSSSGGHPQNCIFLTCDAFGVLPPVARLTPQQAMYHFLSGYTAKVAGTERGVTEPQATFSACFGAAFLTLHPSRYADLLQRKLEEHGTHTYLVNTGWTGGAYGTGSRMPIAATRACIDAILGGDIRAADFETDPVFGFDFPTALPGVPDGLLDPRNAWEDKDDYDAQRLRLAEMFKDNYRLYQEPGATDYSAGGPLV